MSCRILPIAPLGSQVICSAVEVSLRCCPGVYYCPSLFKVAIDVFLADDFLDARSRTPAPVVYQRDLSGKPWLLLGVLLSTMPENELFSTRALKIAQQIHQEEDTQKREEHMIDLAEEVLRTHDASDLEIDDEVHSYFEALTLARAQYRQAALRVGRLVSHSIEMSDQVSGEVAPEKETLN